MGMIRHIVFGCTLVSCVSVARGQAIATREIVIGPGAADPTAASLLVPFRQVPIINNNGVIAVAAIDFSTIELTSGVYTTAAGGRAKLSIPSVGQSSEGAQYDFDIFDGSMAASLNDNGDFGFTAFNNVTDVSGLYTYRNGIVDAVVEVGDVLVAGAPPVIEIGHIQGVGGGSGSRNFFTPSISANGAVATRVTTVDGVVGFPIVVGDGATRSLVARFQDTTVAGSVISIPLQRRPSINDAGHVAYLAAFQGSGFGSTPRAAILSDGSVNIELLAVNSMVGSNRVSAILPGSNAVTGDTSLSGPNNSGQVAVAVVLDGSGGGGARRAVVLTDGQTSHLLIDQGVTVQGVGYRLTDIEVLNDAGQIVGLGEVVVGSSSTDAILRAGPSETVVVAQVGDAAPGGGTITSLDDPLPFVISRTMNEAGQVLFHATVTDSSDDVGLQALLFFDDELGLLELGRGGVGVSTSIGNTGLDGDGINDRGEVVYSNEDNAIVLWTPPDIDDVVPGDANLDGVVTILDFAILRDRFGESDRVYFTNGDFNLDGVVSILDFALLRASFGGSSADLAAIDEWAATVPEPAWSLGLLSLAALRRRHRGR